MSGINLRSKGFLESMRIFEDDRKISADFVLDVLKDAIIKTYQKHIDAPAAVIRVESDGKEMRIYHDFLVVEDEDEQFDETLDIQLSDARKINPAIKLGETIAEEVDFNEIGRSSISIAKNMLKQRIKEYEKQRVYDEYADKVYDLILGTVKTTEEKFILIDIKNTIGIMLKSEQIPGEVYRENQQIRTVIKEVSKNSKGSQVSLSRADAMFVKRLFEKEVPEIAQGIVEIKAIAREAGERTKMAVYSRNEEVDAIGACIGPRGQRVQAVISEIRGEKIDIFEWNENIGELVKNALAPAEVLACFYADLDDKDLSPEEIARRNKRAHRPLVVVVADDQLSSAIGKRGKNAKLAVKLTDCKIDIKTKSEVAELGIDVAAKVLEFQADQERIRYEAIKAQEESERAKFMALQEEASKRKAEFDAELAAQGDLFEDVMEEMTVKSEPERLTKSEAIVKEAKVETAMTTAEVTSTKETAETKKVTKVKEVKPKQERVVKMRESKADDYVSKLEKLAEGSKKENPKVQKKKKRRNEDDERRLRASALKHDKDYEFTPEYSDEELAEIEALQDAEEEKSWINDEIDFDEFDDYYDKD